ncbi:MAG: hypothetical protein KGZ82_10780 [Bacteroidales bacterium]|nr:hypothetical protein [Bacteroidales bacterium]
MPELSAGEMPVIGYDALKKYINRSPHIRVRRGSPAGPALLSWSLLRDDIKARYIDKYGEPDKALRRNLLRDLFTPDAKASTYFAAYELEDGRRLPAKVQVEYTTNAALLNAISGMVGKVKGRAKSLGSNARNVWEMAAHAINELDKDEFPHSLPGNPVRLREKLKAYMSHGYDSLIHKGYCNTNSRKVNDQMERLLLSIYCMKNLPFIDWVHDYYLRFVSGQLEVVDSETGQLFDRADFFDNTKDTFISISRATVWNVVNNPANKVIIDRLRNNRIDHVTRATPFNHRRLPQYSLSKITMDDRTFSRKTIDGKWYNSYVAFDVLSGAILGSTQSVEKPSVGMVWECFRDMYRNLEANNLMWPAEVEVENHLMKDIEEELRAMFAYVTFTAPGLSRSKRAEHLIRGKKYGDEKRHQVGIGRWNGKGAYKTKSEGKDEDYKQPRLSIERLDAEERESISRYNHSLHPNQKMFPGKTRWQVLVENINPDLGRPQRYKLTRYLGLSTQTSLRNNDFVTVQYEKYAIDSYSVLTHLKANNYSVQAYYVPGADGIINEVYLYQGDTFLSRAARVEGYNEAKAERTPADEAVRQSQAVRQARFFKMEREGIEGKILRNIEIIESSKMASAIEAAVEIAETTRATDNTLDELMTMYGAEYYKNKALNDI